MTTDDAVRALRARTALVPDVGVILGTGLGRLADDIRVEASVPYAEIPGFVSSTVETHAGRLLLGTLEGRRIAAMQGRFHAYEGYTLAQVTWPVRVLRALGAETLIVSNACGGMQPLWDPGDLVLLADHLNLLGDNPLAGPNDDAAGPRFPDMSRAYDDGLRALARAVALERGIVLREVGLSIITDRCLPDALEPASVERIIATARAAEPALAALVRGVLARSN